MELTRDCGPKEKDELKEGRGRAEPDGILDEGMKLEFISCNEKAPSLLKFRRTPACCTRRVFGSTVTRDLQTIFPSTNPQIQVVFVWFIFLIKVNVSIALTRGIHL